MEKRTTIIIACILLLIMSALSLLFAYLEWTWLWFIVIIFSPFLLMLLTEKVLVRILIYFGAVILLFVIGAYFDSLFTHIIIVKGSPDYTYTVEKVRKGSTYEYCDASGTTKSIVVQHNSVNNQTKRPLRLYEVTYSTTLFFGNGGKNLIVIPACSMVTIPKYPDYILETPPESITIRKSRFDNEKTSETKTVLSF